jgi:hypothetical protein
LIARYVPTAPLVMAVIISVVALIFSASVFVHNRIVSKRDLLIRVHVDALDAERQQGRRVLFEVHEAGTRPSELSDEQMRVINHAVASLDVMCYLMYRKYVPVRDAVALWGVAMVRAHHAAEESGYFKFRDDQIGMPIWRHLRATVAWLKAGAKGSIRVTDLGEFDAIKTSRQHSVDREQ